MRQPEKHSHKPSVGSYRLFHNVYRTWYALCHNDIWDMLYMPQIHSPFSGSNYYGHTCFGYIWNSIWMNAHTYNCIECSACEDTYACGVYFCLRLNFCSEDSFWFYECPFRCFELEIVVLRLALGISSREDRLALMMYGMKPDSFN